MRYAGFVGPSYVSVSPNAANERTINWMPEVVEVPYGKSRRLLVPTPGFSSFVTLAQSPSRGLFRVEDRVLAVGGDQLFDVRSDGTAVALGSPVEPSFAPATFATNGVDVGQVVFASGTKVYLLTLSTNAVTKVLDDAQMVAFLNGHFLALDPLLSQFKASALLDGTSWPGASVAERTLAADRWQSMLVAHGDVWLFGSETTELWQYSGVGDPPFDPIDGAFLEVGIAAKFSAALLDNAPVWLGRSRDGAGMVFRADGIAPRRISNHALEHAIAGYATIDDAEGWTYQERGHSVYVLSFPTEGVTWGYDAATQEWHERGFWSPAANAFLTYRPRCHAYAFGKHLVGDRSSGRIFEMSSDFATDMDGNGIRRVRRAPHLSAEQKRVFYDSLQVDFEAGLGLVSGQGSDPTAMMRYSNDGGRTWSNERTVSVGAQGQYSARAKWNRLGSGRNRVFEVSVSDPIPWRVTDAYLGLSEGVH